MAVVFENFTQPSLGGTINIKLTGDPSLYLDQTIRFMRYGTYRVQQVITDPNAQNPEFRQYAVNLQGLYASGNVTIPAGTVAVVEGEGVSHSNLSYSPVIYLNFKEDDYRSLLLQGNIIFAAQRHAPAKSITVRMRNLSGTLSRSLSFPNSWIFLGTKPTSIAPSRTGILSITSFGTSDGDVIAAWAAQA